MLKSPATILLFFLFLSSINAQNLNICLIDEQKSPLAFAQVAFSDAQVTDKMYYSNEKGLISIPSPQFPAHLTISFVGLAKQNINYDVLPYGTDTIVLLPESYQLETFELSANEEDPAYPIIRLCKEKRKDYLEELNNYSAKVYMKSSAHLDELSPLITALIQNQSGDTAELPEGMIYLSESVTDYFQNKPQYKEEMLASKVAGFKDLFSFNRVRTSLINFYESRIYLDGISERDFISPIGPDCFFYYKYRLEGSSYNEKNEKTYKIEVIPKRKIDPCFHGYIYIRDTSYRIERVDFKVYKEAQLEFIDSLHLTQSMKAFTGSDTWIVEHTNLYMNFGFMGIKGRFFSLAEFSNYDLNWEAPKKFYSNEIFTVKDSAKIEDADYWKEQRLSTLTEEEAKHYEKTDSIYELNQSQAYLDSMDRIYNKFKPLAYLTSGYDYNNTYNGLQFHVDGPLNSINYNTVEGYQFELATFFKKRYKKYGFHKIQIKGRAGFGNKTIYPFGMLSYHWKMNNKNKSSLKISGGYYLFETNNTTAISPLMNSIYTMLDVRNFMKFYQKSFFKASYFREWFNGFYGTLNAEYIFDRKRIDNQYDHKFIPRERDYTPNYWFQTDPSNGLVLEANVRYVINQKYESYPDQKVAYDSKWPTLYLSYKKGLGFNDNSIDFDYIEGGLGKKWDFRVFGELETDVYAGTFLNKAAFNLIDVKHFRGNRTHIISYQESENIDPLARQRNNRFSALGYFEKSTTKPFIEWHARHHFRGFIWNKLPLLRKLKWQVYMGANGLIIDGTDPYQEAYVGLENIFKVLEVQVASRILPNQKINPEFRIGLKLNL